MQCKRNDDNNNAHSNNHVTKMRKKRKIIDRQPAKKRLKECMCVDSNWKHMRKVIMLIARHSHCQCRWCDNKSVTHSSTTFFLRWARHDSGEMVYGNWHSEHKSLNDDIFKSNSTSPFSLRFPCSYLCSVALIGLDLKMCGAYMCIYTLYTHKKSFVTRSRARFTVKLKCWNWMMRQRKCLV